MGEVTKISWCQHTFNPWIGCTKVSPACDGCYAEAMMDKRYHRVEWGGPGKGTGTRIRTSESNWRDPLKWNRAAEAKGTRPFVFCASLADIFDNQVDPEWRRDAFDRMRETPRLVYLLLTKRPQNIVELSRAVGGLPSNAAIGTTIEDQKRAELNVPHLLAAKAVLDPAFAFLSCEPLLGPINLRSLSYDSGDRLPELFRVNEERCSLNALEGRTIWPNSHYISLTIPDGHRVHDGELWTRAGRAVAVDWVITGGETDQGGHKARPTHPGWFRSLRDQCAAAGVPFHHKQNGEWLPHQPAAGGDLGGDMRRGVVDIVHLDKHTDEELCRRSFFKGDIYMRKVGKRLSGRLLDGIEHNGFPTVPV